MERTMHKGEIRHEVRLLLEALLIQAEQPARKQVARVHLTKRGFAWYFSGDELGLRGQVHEQLQHLALQGFLKLNWQKYEQGNLLASIDLANREIETIEALCAWLGRTPLRSQREALRLVLLEQELIGGWFDRFLEWAMMQLEEYRSPLPLSIVDVQGSRDLLRVLSAVAQLQTPMLARVLSIELFGKSKRVDELLGKVITVLRQFTTDAPLYEGDDWALLQAYNVYRPSEYIPVVGSLSLVVPSTSENSPLSPMPIPLHMDAALPSIGLSEEILRSAQITSCSAMALVTVENQTSFCELLQVRSSSVCVVYIGGFASPALIIFLRTLRRFRPDQQRCPQCGNRLQARGNHARTLQTTGGEAITLHRRYLKCPR
ncbi:hypothetical protein, partial [Dictyobacter arantiisoli]|uniref:hypothetical protein n=1 Tax=Dictyobacter arantiisoli TaxID=2014874 RepID=UPI0011EFEE18